MSFKFFKNSMLSGADPMPDQMYRDIQQNYVDIQWDNTTAMITVEEQDEIGSDKYHDIEVWIDSTVADTTTGLKDSNDFNKLIFKDVNHRVARGMMYRFDNNYWIINNYSQYSGVVQQCGIRRCNNRLKIIDPLNGKLQVIPCCVDYDMTSPSQQTSRYIITPNNHATIIVQGNDLTTRLFKVNTRYMLSGRPFKLLAYQNAVEYSEEEQQSTLLYLDLYLDELRDKDDVINNIADNGIFDYSITINSNDMSLTAGSSGMLTADVIFNGIETVRSVVWKTSNAKIVSINSDGEYIVNGVVGDTATITAELEGNSDINSQIDIEIVDDIETVAPLIIINPTFDKIRQNESIDFDISVEYLGMNYTEFDSISVELENGKDNAQLVAIDNNRYTIVGLKVSRTPIAIKVGIVNTQPQLNIEQSFEFKVVSMMG